jgi:hypothetical protein
MKIYSAALVAASMLGALAVSSAAQAMPAAPGLRAPAAVEVENVACTNRTVTSWNNGRRVTRTVRTCTPGWQQSRARACHTERQRIVRPNGRVVWQTKQVCRGGPRWR